MSADLGIYVYICINIHMHIFINIYISLSSGDNDMNILSVLCFDTMEPLKNTEIVQNRLLYEFLKDDGEAYKKYGVKGVKNRQVIESRVDINGEF
jgi:hypothetical protein